MEKSFSSGRDGFEGKRSGCNLLEPSKLRVLNGDVGETDKATEGCIRPNIQLRCAGSVRYS